MSRHFPECPRHVPFHSNSRFMSVSFCRYVRFIFNVCPFLSLPIISLHLHSCPCPAFAFQSPPVLISSPFMSLSVPLRVPDKSFFLCCRLPVPCMSWHFPLFPFSCPCTSGRKHVFSRFSQDVRRKKQKFCDSGSPRAIFSGASSDCHACGVRIRRPAGGEDWNNLSAHSAYILY